MLLACRIDGSTLYIPPLASIWISARGEASGSFLWHTADSRQTSRSRTTVLASDTPPRAPRDGSHISNTWALDKLGWKGDPMMSPVIHVTCLMSPVLTLRTTLCLPLSHLTARQFLQCQAYAWSLFRSTLRTARARCWRW